MAGDELANVAEHSGHAVGHGIVPQLSDLHERLVKPGLNTRLAECRLDLCAGDVIAQGAGRAHDGPGGRDDFDRVGDQIEVGQGR